MKKGLIYKVSYYSLGLAIFVFVGYLSMYIADSNFFQFILGFLCFIVGVVFMMLGFLTDGGTDYEKRNAADPKKAFLLVATAASRGRFSTSRVPSGIYEDYDKKHNQREYIGKNRYTFDMIAAVVVIIVYLFFKFTK